MEDKIYNTKEERDYVEYIGKHIANVRKSYEAREKFIALALDLSMEEREELKNRILIHDKSKYSKEEFEGYRQWFYPAPGETKDKSKFDIAWKHHYEHNDHHPEYWKGKDMPKVAIAEMICDWEAMSRNFGGNPLEYFNRDKENKKKSMSENTFRIIEKALMGIYDINDNLKEE